MREWKTSFRMVCFRQANIISCATQVDEEIWHVVRSDWKNPEIPFIICIMRAAQADPCVIVSTRPPQHNVWYAKTITLIPISPTFRFNFRSAQIDVFYQEQRDMISCPSHNSTGQGCLSCMRNNSWNVHTQLNFEQPCQVLLKELAKSVKRQLDSPKQNRLYL